MQMSLHYHQQVASQALPVFKYKKQVLLGIVCFGILGLTSFVWANLPAINNLGSITPVSSKIMDRNGNLLYEIHGETKRSPVALEYISPHFINATIAVEDHDFRNHIGVSGSAIIRATVENLKNKSVTQGGSTITQQLAKNLLLTREKSLKRKVNEALLAVWIETKYSKDEILEMYLNTTPYGRNTYGVEAASLAYFNHANKHLTFP